MKVLVVFGSKRGGTAGLASMIGHELDSAGLEAVIRSARSEPELSEYAAVVVAGALYAGRWHPDARRFVRRHADKLATMPVWLVSSGPLDTSAATKELQPVRQVAKLAALVGARGQVTFGGVLQEHPKGLVARAMARKFAGDWRDPEHVHRWAAAVASQLFAVERFTERNKITDR